MMAAVKISDYLSKNNKTFSCSLEVVPTIPFEDIDEVTNPVFYAITWHAKAYDFKTLDIAPLNLANRLRSKGKNVLLHLSCVKLRKPYLDEVLTFLEGMGVCNLFVMLGECYDENESDFKNTKELIEYIRATKKTYFCIGVAGFSGDSNEKIKQLNEKIKSGADFVLTQAIFDAHSYIDYVNMCKSLGITVPIIPGLFLYETHQELANFVRICKISVPKDLLQDALKENTGKEVIKKIIADLRNSDLKVNHFHFFTMNKMERISKFVQEL